MKNVDEFIDDRQKTWCIHCNRPLAGIETNDDHVPTKSLLRKPRPLHLPTVTICRECNNGFSRDEQYLVAFLSCVLAGSTDPKKQENASAARALAKSPALRAIIQGTRIEVAIPDGGLRVAWVPDGDRIERVVLKNARGHAHFEYGGPVLDAPTHVWATPLSALSQAQREEFEGEERQGVISTWPEVGSRMMTRLASGEDMVDGWVIVQEGVYRYRVDQVGDLRIRSILNEYLATEVQWGLVNERMEANYALGPIFEKLARLRDAVIGGRSRATCLRRWSAFIRERDGHRCVECHSHEHLSAHHICRKSFLTGAQFQTGNGITLCRGCHRKVHEGFNRRPDLAMPADAQGGEKLALMERLYSTLLDDAVERGMLSEDLYFLSDEVLGTFKRMQGYKPDASFPGARLEQAYLILAEPELNVRNAILEANGIAIGDQPMLPGGLVLSFGSAGKTTIIRNYLPRSK